MFHCKKTGKELPGRRRGMRKLQARLSLPHKYTFMVIVKNTPTLGYIFTQQQSGKGFMSVWNVGYKCKLYGDIINGLLCPGSYCLNQQYSLVKTKTLYIYLSLDKFDIVSFNIDNMQVNPCY